MDMKGEHMGILIGKRGQTLDALQYLANRVANKHQAGYVRVKLDTENYRARREETLKQLAKNISETLNTYLKANVLISDTDKYISIAGSLKNKYLPSEP